MYVILAQFAIMLVIALAFTSLYRMHGGAKPKLPWKLDEILISCFVAGAVFVLTQNLWLTGITALLTAVFKATGHGQYMTLSFYPPITRRISPERIDFLLKPFFGKDPRTEDDWAEITEMERIQRIRKYGNKKLYNRCCYGLLILGALTGLCITASLIFAGQYLFAFLSAFLFSFAKPVGYILGWAVYPHYKSGETDGIVDESTEIGEAIAGFIPGLFLGFVYALTFFN